MRRRRAAIKGGRGRGMRPAPRRVEGHMGAIEDLIGPDCRMMYPAMRVMKGCTAFMRGGKAVIVKDTNRFQFLQNEAYTPMMFLEVNYLLFGSGDTPWNVGYMLVTPGGTLFHVEGLLRLDTRRSGWLYQPSFELNTERSLKAVCHVDDVIQRKKFTDHMRRFIKTLVG